MTSDQKSRSNSQTYFEYKQYTNECDELCNLQNWNLKITDIKFCLQFYKWNLQKNINELL